MIPAAPVHRWIAIVDDDDSAREAMQNLFASMGLSAVAFASAEEFLDAEFVDQPSCMFLDVQMPGMDGLTLQQRLLGAGRRIPIVFISAYLDYRKCVSALKSGAVCFLTKPCNEDELLDGLRAALALP